MHSLLNCKISELNQIDTENIFKNSIHVSSQSKFITMNRMIDNIQYIVLQLTRTCSVFNNEFHKTTNDFIIIKQLNKTLVYYIKPHAFNVYYNDEEWNYDEIADFNKFKYMIKQWQKLDHHSDKTIGDYLKISNIKSARKI